MNNVEIIRQVRVHLEVAWHLLQGLEKKEKEEREKEERESKIPIRPHPIMEEEWESEADHPPFVLINKRGIYVLLAIRLMLLATADSRRPNRHHYLAHTPFCDPCVVNVAVEMVENPAYNQAVLQEECPGIPYLMQVFIGALTNDMVEIREILENERRQITMRHVSHPDFIPTGIPIFEDLRICPLINDLIPSGNYLNEYTAVVYGKFIVLASHLRVVIALGNVSPDINLAHNKLGHALCKLKQFRKAMGIDTSLSNMCHYNEIISLFSKTEKIDYSISVLKYGADSLTTILSMIKEIVLRESRGCNITCGSERQKTLVCP